MVVDVIYAKCVKWMKEIRNINLDKWLECLSVDIVEDSLDVSQVYLAPGHDQPDQGPVVRAGADHALIEAFSEKLRLVLHALHWKLTSGLVLLVSSIWRRRWMYSSPIARRPSLISPENSFLMAFSNGCPVRFSYSTNMAWSWAKLREHRMALNVDSSVPNLSSPGSSATLVIL